MSGCAGVTRCIGECFEIDMGSEIGGARIRERVAGLPGAYRLQAVAGEAVLRAVVEEEGRARVGEEAMA